MANPIPEKESFMFRKRILLPIVLAGFALLACNLLTSVNQTATPTIRVVQTELPTPQVQQPTETVSTKTLPPFPQEKSAAATQDPQSACLVGVWQPVNIGNYLVAAIPADAIPSEQVSFKNTTGQIWYKFNSDKTFGVSAQDLKLNFNVKVNILTLGLEIGINGPANGGYSLSGNELITENVQTDQLSAHATMSGAQVVEPAVVISYIPLLKPPFNQAEYQCNGNSLTLKINAMAQNVPAISLERVNP
jgi:hypothetical protein